MKDCVCWYCEKCIICKRKERGIISKCEYFIQDTPFPISKKEFEEKYKITLSCVYTLKKRYLNKDYLQKYKERKQKLLIVKSSRAKTLIKAIDNQRNKILKAFYYYNLYKRVRHPLDYSSFDFNLAQKKLLGAEKWL